MNEEIELYECSLKKYENLFMSENDDKIKINKQFLLLENANEFNTLNIYDLKTFQLFKLLKLEYNINYFDFHNHYEIIFFVCFNKDVIIYEIDIENKKINKLSLVKGHFTQIIYASFSPFYPNFFLSVSINKEIKIYDISKSLPISHIFLDEWPIYASKIKWGMNNIGIMTKSNISHNFNNDIILIQDYELYVKEYTYKISFNDKIKDFYFYDDYILIALTAKDIKFALNKDDITTIYSMKKPNQNYNNFYYKKKKLLILFFSNEIVGLSINYKRVTEIFSYFVTIFNPLFFIKENFLGENEVCKVYSIYDWQNISYSINIKNPNSESKIIYISSNKEEIKDFLNKIAKVISDIPLLLSIKNNEENNYNKNKKYFNYKEIQIEFDLIKKRNLLKRKEELKNNIDKINTINDIEKKYIFILKLIINDNTNIDLLLNYLIFLKEKENELKKFFNNDIEEYNSELECYLNIISKKDADEYLKIKKKSQMDELFEFMENLLKNSKNNIIFK